MSNTSISVDKKIRNRAYKKAKEDMLSLSAVIRILMIDYADGKIRIGTQPTEIFHVERIEVDEETQSLMDEVISEWNK